MTHDRLPRHLHKDARAAAEVPAAALAALETAFAAVTAELADKTRHLDRLVAEREALAALLSEPEVTS